MCIELNSKTQENPQKTPVIVTRDYQNSEMQSGKPVIKARGGFDNLEIAGKDVVNCENTTIASQTHVTPSKSKTLHTFPRFSSLPPEVRLIIWFVPPFFAGLLRISNTRYTLIYIC